MRRLVHREPEQPLIPPAARFNIFHADQRLWTQDAAPIMFSWIAISNLTPVTELRHGGISELFLSENRSLGKPYGATISLGQVTDTFTLTVNGTITQKGTITEKMGSCRPIMPESCSRSRPVTAASAITGVPSAP